MDQILRQFGKEAFRPLQREIIDCVMAGHSCVCVLPTGLGKSLCYQIPAVLLKSVSIVVSPLIALMRDQVEGLRSIGICAGAYHSALDDDERAAILESVGKGEMRLLYVAPESLRSEALNAALDKADLGVFVVDEAHCLSEWGHSFRQDYLALPRYAGQRKFHAVMAVTATATPRVRGELAGQFNVVPDHVFAMSPTRANIARRVESISPDHKNEALVAFLEAQNNVPAIVYVQTRQDAEDVAAMLAQQGWRVKAYHAGLPADGRLLIEEAFHSGETDVLVATIAFGMGVDKANVRAVVHYHAPASIEAYVQESGRAGRDGLPASSFVMWAGRDHVMAENRLYASVPERQSLRMFLRQFAVGGELVLSYYEETTRCDMQEAVMKRILFDLEEAGDISVKGSGHYYYKLKPLFSLEEILQGRSGDEVGWLRWLAAHKEGSVWDASIAMGVAWDAAYELIATLELSGEWQVSMRQACVWLEVCSPIDAALAEAHYVDYYAKVQLEGQLDKLQACRRLFLSEGCYQSSLADYFGFEGEGPCGVCSSCLKKIPCQTTLDYPATAVEDEVIDRIMDLAAQGHAALKSPIQWSRFLLGFLSPAQMRARLWSSPLYGILREQSWNDVKDIVAVLPLSRRP